MELNKNFLRTGSMYSRPFPSSVQSLVATMLQEDHENKLCIGSFLEDAAKNTFRRPDEIGPVELTNMVNGAHESDGSNGYEQEDAVES
jgi:hypothetical protein